MMRTRAKMWVVASDRARRENVPRHILFHMTSVAQNSAFKFVSVNCPKERFQLSLCKHSAKPLKTWSVFSNGFHASWVLSPLHKEKLSIFLLCNLTIKVMKQTFWHPNLYRKLLRNVPINQKKCALRRTFKILLCICHICSSLEAAVSICVFISGRKSVRKTFVKRIIRLCLRRFFCLGCYDIRIFVDHLIVTSP